MSATTRSGMGGNGGVFVAGSVVKNHVPDRRFFVSGDCRGEGVFCPQCGEGFFASRVHYARIHCFSIFAFTSSPLCRNGLNCRVISVKASPRKAFTDGVG